ncbi:MAG: anti-sigma factor antagonist [Pedosphaera sp.]|nr:anti-sigma factor antagonist [Pedosphaera sp.]
MVPIHVHSLENLPLHEPERRSRGRQSAQTTSLQQFTVPSLDEGHECLNITGVSPTEANRLLVLEETPIACLKVIGRATAKQAPGFAKAIEGMQSRGVCQFIVDLSECLTMDSTFSGKLVFFALANLPAPLSPEKGKRFILVRPNAAILDLLDTLYVMEFFTIAHAYDGASLPTGEAREQPVTPVEKSDVNECCLDAHQVLSQLHPKNAEKFKDVVRFLEEELASKATPPIQTTAGIKA